MIQKAIRKTSDEDFSSLSIEEEIISKKKEYIPESEFSGPTTHLFFHELENRCLDKDSRLSFLIGVIVYILFLATFPLIWGLLRLSGISHVFTSYRVNGLYGQPFEVQHFNISIYQDPTEEKSEPVRIQKFLFKSGLYKLPLSKNLLKRQICLKGPQPLQKSIAQKYIRRYTDFYKRYAVQPGFISPASYFHEPGKNISSDKNLNAELKFLISKLKS
jgi:lipopolysaccharide/colanic/teichoic acid biosynthesis glycosyltransferase